MREWGGGFRCARRQHGSSKKVGVAAGVEAEAPVLGRCWRLRVGLHVWQRAVKAEQSGTACL